MKNLVLNYFEEMESVALEVDGLRYCDKLNLTVDKDNEPAIAKVNMATQTFTKTDGEASDSDRDQNMILMSTKTRTFTEVESTDNDRDISLHSLMATKTLTESQEVLDADK